MSFRDDLDQLMRLPRVIEAKRGQVRRLREQMGLRSPNLSGMPGAPGTRDRIGDTMPDVIDAETELVILEQELVKVRDRVRDQIDQIGDLKAALILGLRYLDHMEWEQIADELDTGDGDMTGDAARHYANRYIRKLDTKGKEINGESR